MDCSSAFNGCMKTITEGNISLKLLYQNIKTMNVMRICLTLFYPLSLGKIERACFWVTPFNDGCIGSVCSCKGDLCNGSVKTQASLAVALVLVAVVAKFIN